MKALLRPSLLVLGTTAALVGGGSVLAFAGWTSRTVSPTFTIHATKVPQVQKPIVTLIKVSDTTVLDPSSNPKIQWTKVELTPDDAVHRYIVTRHAGPNADIVCTLAATKTPVCIDKTAPAGYTLTYTVAATYGTNWVGRDSEPSPVVTMPGTPVVLPPAAASAAPSRPAVSAPASSLPSVTPVTPSAGPTTLPATEVPTQDVSTPVTDEQVEPDVSAVPSESAPDEPAPG